MPRKSSLRFQSLEGHMARIATFNLYHFAEPGIFWHERKDRNTYTSAEWVAKTGWIRAKLAAADADVVGFQEVVSTDALRSLCEAVGYPYFAQAGEVLFDPEDTGVYVNAVVALASRIPFLSVGEVQGTVDIQNNTVLDESFEFARVPLRAEIDLPELGPTPIYVCHFKSQGAFVRDDAIDAIEHWQKKLQSFFANRVRAGVDQVARRGGEAGAMYQLLMRDLEQDLNRPVILIGDLNEGPTSHTLEILTQEDRLFSIGSLNAQSIPAAALRFKYSYRLYDAYTALSPQTQIRPITHSGFGQGTTLDYVIVSNGLNARNPSRTGQVLNYKVHDDHFISQTDKRTSSDHAPVVVRFGAKPASV